MCIEALSVTLDRRMLESSARSVNKLQSKVTEMKASDSARLVTILLVSVGYVVDYLGMKMTGQGIRGAGLWSGTAGIESKQ